MFKTFAFVVVGVLTVEAENTINCEEVVQDESELECYLDEFKDEENNRCIKQCDAGEKNIWDCKKKVCVSE